MLVTQCNLASTYNMLRRHAAGSRMLRAVYSGRLKLFGEEDRATLMAANNYAAALKIQRRFEEAKALLRKTMLVARRVLGESHHLMLRMRWIYGEALYTDDGATLDDLREAVTALEDAGRIARRVFGGTHPLTVDIGHDFRDAQAALRANEDTQP